MRARTLGLLASVLALALVFDVAAAARPRPPGGGGGGGSGGGSPTAPTSLRITEINGRNLSLAWDASTGGGTWWYCVQREGQGCFRVDPPTTTFVYPYLWPGTTYNFTVIAINSNGQRSAPSNVVTHTTPPDTNPPTAPTLSLGQVWPTRVSVSWTRSTDAETPQVWNTLLVDGVPHPWFTETLGVGNALLLWLVPGSTHTFQVTVRDYFHNRNESNVVTVTTPPPTEANPPTVPQNLRLSSETSAPEIWLDWDASTDDTDSQALILYEVFVNDVRVDFSASLGAPETLVYCQATGSNRIAVRAVDTSGNASAFSNEIEFTC